MKKYWSFLLLVSLPAIGVFFYFAFLRSPSDEEVTKSLEKMIPGLEKNDVVVYRKQDWCQVIEYEGKAYSNNDVNTCTFVTKLRPERFTFEAWAKLEEVAATLSSSPVKIVSLVQTRKAKGRFSYVEFHLDCDLCRTRYVYSPEYKSTPADIPEELLHYRINANWYRVEEDWN